MCESWAQHNSVHLYMYSPALRPGLLKSWFWSPSHAKEGFLTNTSYIPKYMSLYNYHLLMWNIVELNEISAMSHLNPYHIMNSRITIIRSDLNKNHIITVKKTSCVESNPKKHSKKRGTHTHTHTCRQCSRKILAASGLVERWISS